MKNIFTHFKKYLGAFCLNLILLGALYAQERVISGKVSATSGEPLPGVTVSVKGTNSGAITDVDGKYQVKIVGNGTVLIFSAVGMNTQEVQIGEQASLDIQMTENIQGLEEIVVTALGIEKEKAKLGYAVQAVQGQDLVKAREPNPINALTGKVAGLTVGSSAELLGAPNILLRGRSQLLYVMDGVPLQSDTWNISPDDVESYTVLKGPAATALYGSRGQNGAILITTKRGSKDKRGFSVEVNSSTMLENGFLTIPKVQDEYGPGDHGRYAFADGRGGGLYDSDYDVWGPRFEGQLIPQYNGERTPGTTYTTTFPNGQTWTGIIKPTPWLARGRDNLRNFMQTGVLATNNVAVSSGNDVYDLRFSFTHTHQQGVIPNTRLNSINFNTTLGLNFTPKLRFEANVNFNRQSTPNTPDVQYGPNSLIYNMIIWGGADWSVDDMRNYWQPGKEGIQQIYADYTRYNNPWFVVKEWLRGHYKTDVYGYALMRYKITSYLTAMVRSQVTTYDLFRDEKMPYSATSYGREQAKGDYREDRRNLFENNTDFLITFDKDVVSNLNINASLGGNLRTMRYSSNYASTDYLNVPGWYNLNNTLNPRQVFNYDAKMQVASWYGLVDASYKGFLNLSLTGRWDKTSAMNTGNNSFFYYSAGAGVVVSEMIKMPQPISFLKVRGTYAYVGDGQTRRSIGPAYSQFSNIIGYGAPYNTPFEGPSYANAAAYGISFPYNNQPSARFPDALPNPNLQPSFSSSFETGIEMKFLNNRLGLDVAYFNSLDGPFIFNLQPSETTGYSSFIENGLKTQRQGWEISLTGTPIKAKSGFTWDVLVNWSTFKETLKEIYPGVDRYNVNNFNDSRGPVGDAAILRVGDRIDKFYHGAFIRDQQGNIINGSDGRPIVNPYPQFLGNLFPDFTFGINNKFSYKNLSLSFQFDGRIGGVIVNQIQRQTFRGGRHIATVEGNMGIIRENDTRGIETFIGHGVLLLNGSPRYDNSGNITNYNELTFGPNTSATYVQDWISRYYGTYEGSVTSRSFAKLREITLGYNLPSAWLSRTFIRQASVSLVARNVLYFAGRRDLDLDQFTGNRGYSDLQTPTLRRYGINVNLTF
ncbi:MAG: SusC/RagA family TonB-linked outer membrane protein [Microscillaceae bacterium]|jgi:TonB-linked SusC/RagA family outer membrane protein|nr:SusC/RagA family TonB-linked outer membrane protein [Microscillaceae bacterium]